jgi:hypothetical protein
MMWLHGAGNFGILLGGVGIAIWRSFHRPGVAGSLLGLGAAGLAIYTAYLGGEMVYGRGVGVRALPRIAPTGVRRSPPVLSRAAPGAFARDAIAGLVWLLRRTSRALLGRRPIDRYAYGLREEPSPVASLEPPF